MIHTIFCICEISECFNTYFFLEEVYKHTAKMFVKAHFQGPTA